MTGIESNGGWGPSEETNSFYQNQMSEALAQVLYLNHLTLGHQLQHFNQERSSNQAICCLLYRRSAQRFDVSIS